ncbi:MAG: efflux RND transporter periplasmic adaptor subunit [Aphanothece sp. CMT-3BRIN-NPC111]|nr:efflux RND transporter periplasmic adaptor subunit [Aphanothece sp. CMT-3BRIN-NPC111]
MAHESVSDEKQDAHQALQAPLEAQDEFDFDLDSPPIDAKRGARRRWFASRRSIALGTVIALVIGVGAMRFLSKPATRQTQPAQTAAVAPQLSVTVAAVEMTSVSRTLNATGTVAAKELVSVLPQVSNLQIKEISVKEGDTVKVGQVMAVLDYSVLQTQGSQVQADLEKSQADVQQKQAALAQAQAAIAQAQAAVGQAQATLAQNRANLGQAERTLQRYQYLANQGAISRQELDTRVTAVTTAAETVRVAEAGISSAQANVRSAEANVSRAQADVSSSQAVVRNYQARVQQSKIELTQALVFAPVSGTVVAPSAEGRCDGTGQAIARVGDTSGNKALFCLIRNGLLELQVKIPDVQLKEVPTRAPVSVTNNADTRIRLQGRVREVVPLVDPQSRQATVKIDLPYSSLLKPGMFLAAAITSNTAEALTVPAKAVLPQPDGKAVVYLLEGNDTARAQTVEAGTTSGSGDLSTAKVEIKSGLKEGDRVIVQGAGYLKDGDKVQVVNGQ